MSGLTVTAVSKSYGATEVLHSIDLTVPTGSFTAILGPSGCGKTTLLRLIAGFAVPDSGTILLGDRTVFGNGRSVAPQRRRVGYVPQEGALFPHLDVGANIRFGLPRKSSDADRRIDELLELVDLSPDMRKRYPHELSGGQQQRVALARALAPEPSVVLLDEPFASLDAGLRQGTAAGVAQALRLAGATAVLVTHDQDEALSLADEIAVMRDGRIIQTAEPREIYETPTDIGVAKFVGAALVLDAVLKDDQAHTSLGAIKVREPAGFTGEAKVMVRPEQVRLSTLAPHTITSAVGVGRVTEIDYFGHDAFVRIVMQRDGLVVVARLLGTDLPAVGVDVAVSVHGTATVMS